MYEIYTGEAQLCKCKSALPEVSVMFVGPKVTVEMALAELQQLYAVFDGTSAISVGAVLPSFYGGNRVYLCI